MQKTKSLGMVFCRLKSKHGFDFTLHGLRHGHATILLEKKIQTKVVAERLGHANTAITENIYMHITPDMQDEAVEIIDEVLSPLLTSPDTLGVQNGYKSASQK